MALLKTSLALLTLGARLASAQISDEELDQANKNSECTNDCFFDVWTDGQCIDDPACMCNFHDTREEYFCCIAEKCDTGAWEYSVMINEDNCDAFGIPFTFDPEEACGFKPPSSSTTEVESTTVTKTESKTESKTETSADATETTTVAATETSVLTTTASATESAAGESESASATGSPTESSEESSETEDGGNAAAGREVSWVALGAVAGAAMLL